ncbi:cathepsin L, putative [Acanthamoeba castellanii str. Neff]|uniref:Cathepsin L, putative n=1 Tax=Acanthamoeba castellanii (strain ATCC 30010 / Neff) TaxID=1257118 RepID=L8H951_ACACF|nr:cathepsin L, putative [Acanthamoeba castellanii str. Neff]ELR21263.1 cathepsin L, putative [Acanthamoeba castellanii str. Neff]
MRPSTLLALSAALCFFFLASASPDEPLRHADPFRGEFTEWTRTHAKSYSTEEFVFRLSVWRENKRFVEEHNRQNHSYSLGMNQFGDLTADEFRRIYTTDMSSFAAATAPITKEEEEYNATTSEAASPASSVATPRASTGGRGEAYKPSKTRTAHWRKYATLPNLSEQHLVDCTGEYGNGGCSGGWMHTAYRWLQDKGGSVSQLSYPYTASVGACQHAAKPKSAFVQHYTRIPAGNENALLDAVATTGTVAIAYNAGTQAHAYYQGGILDVPNCGNTPTHAVLLVGYGTENGKDFWILKNSWGSGWGEGGYFRLARGKNMCGIADWASYPIAL